MYKSFQAVNPIKNKLVDYIYEMIDISKYKFELLKQEEDLEKLLTKIYFISPNYSGTNCLLVFTKIRDKQYSFLLDRHTISYNYQKINYDTIKIDFVCLKINDNIYNGTIFDGTFIKSYTGNTFVITDVYLFNGKNMEHMTIDNKLKTILSYLSSYYDSNNTENTIELTLNKLYPIKQTKNVIDKIIPNLKTFSIRGVCFYPEISATKLIYLFSNSLKTDDKKDLVKHDSKFNNKYDGKYDKYDKPIEKIKFTEPIKYEEKYEDSEKSEEKITSMYIPKKGKSDDDYNFEMKKTDISDVYILNGLELYKKRMKRKKICYAYIPTMSRSKWCKELFIDADSVVVKCKFHKDKNKWEPVSVTDDKPTLITSFDSISG
jgi:hypothetical protein